MFILTAKSKELPKYTVGEELWNSISHGIGALMAVAALVLLVVNGALAGDAWKITSSCIYGATLIILYLMSTLYHALQVEKAKRVFQVIDHCSIFLLIAGTYTPITLVTLRGITGWVLFGIVWGSAMIGIILNAVNLHRFKKISMICYLAMGWVILFAFSSLIRSMPPRGVGLLLLGGVFYSVGAILYGLGKKKKYMHSIWHLFVLLGSIAHFFTIFNYVMPY